MSGEHHRRRVAVHEAGHALVCRLVDVAIDTVTIGWRGTSHGALVYAGTPPPESLLLILLAGEAAVARANELGWVEQVPDDGYDPPGDAEDVPVPSDAETIKVVLAARHPGDSEAQERALTDARERVDAAVERHWAPIERLATALLRETTLNGDDVRRLITTEP